MPVRLSLSPSAAIDEPSSVSVRYAALRSISSYHQRRAEEKAADHAAAAVEAASNHTAPRLSVFFGSAEPSHHSAACARCIADTTALIWIELRRIWLIDRRPDLPVRAELGERIYHVTITIPFAAPRITQYEAIFRPTNDTDGVPAAGLFARRRSPELWPMHIHRE